MLLGIIEVKSLRIISVCNHMCIILHPLAFIFQLKRCLNNNCMKVLPPQTLSNYKIHREIYLFKLFTFKILIDTLFRLEENFPFQQHLEDFFEVWTIIKKKISIEQECGRLMTCTVDVWLNLFSICKILRTIFNNLFNLGKFDPAKGKNHKISTSFHIFYRYLLQKDFRLRSWTAKSW